MLALAEITPNRFPVDYGKTRPVTAIQRKPRGKSLALQRLDFRVESASITGERANFGERPTDDS
jgi:hypothetical protein